MDNYTEAINILTSQTKFHIKLGLDRTAEMLALLDNPQDKLKIIHVAGTNGKGSVCAMLSRILTVSGYKTGLFTSPHILNYTERIKINDTDISRDDFAENIIYLCNLAEKHNIALTEFEILTICAFKYFADNNVDIVVLETGLGGRLDSTNIIKKNLCSVITSISLDHTDRLGDTIEKITFEKASIIKENCPVVVSPENKGLTVIKDFAKSKNAELLSPKLNVALKFENDINYAIINNKKYEFNLLGLYQKDNLALVFEVVEYLRQLDYKIADENLAQALKTVRWPARFEYLKDKNLILDAAHNPDAAKVLRESLDYYFPNKKRIWIYGTLGTKDYKQIMDILFKKDDEVNFYKFNFKNAVESKELLKIITTAQEISLQGIKKLLHNPKDDSLVVITGSFYMLDEILSSL